MAVGVKKLPWSVHGPGGVAIADRPLSLCQRLWHNFDSMTQDRQPRQGKRPPKPLTSASLRALALHYAGRYATSSGRLASYLSRKLRERGWDDGGEPDLDVLVEDFARLGYIDDAGFASAKRTALLRRGYGPARVRSALHQSGVGKALAVSESAIDDSTVSQASLDFSRRRRFGPYAVGEVDPKARQRAFAAMVRAGHDYAIITEILGQRAESS